MKTTAALFYGRKESYSVTLSTVITPVAMLLEPVICVLGIFAGHVKKKMSGYFFVVTILLFALFDHMNSSGMSADTVAILNIIAVLAALGGMYLIVQDNKRENSFFVTLCRI